MRQRGGERDGQPPAGDPSAQFTRTGRTRRRPARWLGRAMLVAGLGMIPWLVGLVLLGQVLPWTAWLAIAAIAGANAAGAFATSRAAQAARATRSAQTTRTVSRHAVGSPPCESSSSGPAAASTP